jgi:ATP-dependent DNA helicase Rep
LPTTSRSARFTALGLKILRAHASALGLKPSFSILDPGDIEPIVAELDADDRPRRARAAQWQISGWKNALVSPSAAAKAAKNDDEKAAAIAYRRYDDALRAYQAVDFDDLIVLPNALLARDSGAAAKWRERCGHLLVDEYQDTNPVQYRSIRHLVGERAAFTMVGDDDQAIYGWRGASSTISRNCRRIIRRSRWSSSSRTTARRCAFLRSANSLIAGNPKLFDKKLWSEHGHGDPIRIAPPRTTKRKPKASCAAARAPLRASRRHADYAILYRGNHQAKAVRAGAARAGGAVRDLRRPVVLRARRDQGPRRLPAAHRQR